MEKRFLVFSICQPHDFAKNLTLSKTHPTTWFLPLHRHSLLGKDTALRKEGDVSSRTLRISNAGAASTCVKGLEHASLLMSAFQSNNARA